MQKETPGRRAQTCKVVEGGGHVLRRVSVRGVAHYQAGLTYTSVAC